MALEHFERRYRQVRLGGWRVWRFRFGGRLYTVSPRSVVDMSRLWAALSMYTRGEAHRMKPGQVLDAVLTRPGPLVTPLLALLVDEPVRPQDERRVTVEQFRAVWEAFGHVHDLEYLAARCAPAPKGSETPALDFADVAYAVCRETGAYTMRELLSLPAQEFLAILDARRKLAGGEPGRGESEPPADEREARLVAALKAADSTRVNRGG